MGSIQSGVTLGSVKTVFTNDFAVSTYHPGKWDGRYRDPITISIIPIPEEVDVYALHLQAVEKWERG